MNSNNKVWLENVGFSCNNNCLICSVRSGRFADRSKQEILASLARGREQGYDMVEFTGGEPGLRKDLVELIEKAGSLGYKNISLSTNGRVLSYKEVVEKLAQAGLNWVTVSLHGADAKTHEAITRTPDSFSQAVSGIKNIIVYDDIRLSVTSVVCSLNYKNLLDLAEFVSGLGVKNWNVSDLIPEGRAKDNYKFLSVEWEDLGRQLEELRGAKDKFKEVNFFDLPFCIFSKEVLGISNFNFINTRFRGENVAQQGFNPYRIYQEEGEFKDIHKQKKAVCKDCKYKNDCGGFWNIH